MTDHITDTEIHDYVDEALTPDERRSVEAHVEGCPACRVELEAAASLRNAARALPPEIAPARDLWAGIAMRLDPELRVLPSRRLRILRPVLAVAAAVLVVLTAFLTTERLGDGALNEGNDSGEIERAILFRMELAAAESEYEAAARDLQSALAARRPGLAPETAAVIEKNLEIIDAALSESKEALVADPANRTLTDLVASTHRKKVEFLQLALNY